MSCWKCVEKKLQEEAEASIAWKKQYLKIEALPLDHPDRIKLYGDKKHLKP